MNRLLITFEIKAPVIAILLAFLSACQASSTKPALVNRSYNQNSNVIDLDNPATIPTSPVPNGHQDEIPYLGEEHMDIHRKRYCNYEYAYCVEIPEKLIGLSDPSPLPQHAVGIALSKQPKSYVWVNGEYGRFMQSSLGEAVDDHLRYMSDEGTNVEVQRRESTRLKNLPAMRFTVRYKSLATNEVRIHDEIIAFRPYQGEANGIEYTFGLITPEARYNEDVVAFERIVSGWRMRPIPRA